MATSRYRAKTICRIWVLGLLLVIFPAMADEIQIALRANKGREEALICWQATADYLNQAIPEHHFVLVPFENNSALNQAVSTGKYAFTLTNPASAVELRLRYGQQFLATLVKKRQGTGQPQFGSVIFTRANRTDLNSLEDLKGKVFMGVDELGFGGWRVAWYELRQHGIDPYRDFKELRFGGGNQESVVRAVLQGAVDAGSVRTDLLEGLAQKGNVNLSDIKVLGQKKVEGFPFLLSTALFPEWPFLASHTVPPALRQDVARALLSIKPDQEAAKMGQYTGWITPIDYTPVENLLRELDTGPFSATKATVIKAFLHRYALWIFVSLLAVTALVIALVYTVRLNRRLTRAQAQLAIEIKDRERAEQTLSSLARQSLQFAKEDRFFNHCLTDLAQLFSAKYAFIGVFADAEKTRIKTCGVWAGDRFVEDFEYGLEGTPCQDVLNLETELVGSGAAQKYPNDTLLIQMSIDSYFGTPLIAPDGTMMGLTSVMDTKPMDPKSEFKSVLRIFAHRMAIELQRKQEADALQGMAEQLSYQASHDALTNLVNRREFEVRVKAAWSGAKSQQRQHALCFLDLDQFKVVNDTYGHSAGDELLKQIASALSNVVRGSDTLARLGGDEFGVLLLDCPVERALEIANKLLDAVQTHRFRWRNDVFEVGVSIGVIQINAESGEMHELFQLADAACYVAKGQGKNRVHVHGR